MKLTNGHGRLGGKVKAPNVGVTDAAKDEPGQHTDSKTRVLSLCDYFHNIK